MLDERVNEIMHRDKMSRIAFALTPVEKGYIIKSYSSESILEEIERREKHTQAMIDSVYEIFSEYDPSLSPTLIEKEKIIRDLRASLKMKEQENGF